MDYCKYVVELPTESIVKMFLAMNKIHEFYEKEYKKMMKETNNYLKNQGL